MVKKTKRAPLIHRQTTDENFDHTMGLVGVCAAWAETVEIGHRFDLNDLNMIAIPAEIALAFIRDAAGGTGPRAEAARKSLQLLQSFRDIDAQRDASDGRAI